MNKEQIKFEVILLRWRSFVPSLVFTLITLVSVFITYQNARSIWQLRQDYRSGQTELNQVEADLDRIEELKAGELEQYQTIVDEVLPNQKPLFTSLEALSVVAERYDVDLSSLSTRPGSVATPSANIITTTRSRGSNAEYEALRFTVQLFGTTDNIKQFLDGLLNLKPLIGLSSVSINPSADSQAVTSSRLEIEAYYYVGGSRAGQLEQLNSEQLDTITQLSRLESL